MAVVLVAEDDEDQRELFLHMLQRRGHTVLVAADGQSARQLLQKCAADVVVLDLQLPLVSGFELIREIRAEPRWHDTPVIAISAVVPLDAAPSADLPASVVPPKPFPIGAMLDCIDAVLRERLAEG